MAVLPKEECEPPVAEKDSSDDSDSDSDEIPLSRDEGEALLVEENEDANSDEAIGEKLGEVSKVEELVPDAPPVSEEKDSPPRNVVSHPEPEENKDDKVFSQEGEAMEEEDDENLKNLEGESEESDVIPPKPKSTKPARKTSLMSTLWKLLLLIAVSSMTFPICTMMGCKDAQQDKGCLVNHGWIKLITAS